MTRIGPKGQMVIEKELREKLGIGPGWYAVQELSGDRLVVRFEPPLHDRSLAGVLRQYAKETELPDDQQMNDAIGRAIAEEWQQREGAGDSAP